MDQTPASTISEADRQMLDAVASIMKSKNTALSIINTKSPEDLPSNILGDEIVPYWVVDAETRVHMLDSVDFEEEPQMLEEMKGMSDRLLKALRARESTSPESCQSQNIAVLDELLAAYSVHISESIELTSLDKQLTKSLGEDWNELIDKSARGEAASSNTRTSKRSLHQVTTEATTARKRRPIADFSRRVKETTSNGQTPSEDFMDLD